MFFEYFKLKRDILCAIINAYVILFHKILNIDKTQCLTQNKCSDKIKVQIFKAGNFYLWQGIIFL